MSEFSQSVPFSAGNGQPTRDGGSAQVGTAGAFALVAEADGNRTRQRRGAPLTGFEDQGDHQEPRRLRRRLYSPRPREPEPSLRYRHRGTPCHQPARDP